MDPTAHSILHSQPSLPHLEKEAKEAKEASKVADGGNDQLHAYFFLKKGKAAALKRFCKTEGYKYRFMAPTRTGYKKCGRQSGSGHHFAFAPLSNGN